MSKLIPTYPSDAISQLAIVARQPICDQHQRTIGYELLFRDIDSEDCNLSSLNGDDATSRVVFNSIVEIGLGRLVGPLKAFINFTREFILSPNCGLLPRDRVILEILEDSIPDATFLSGLSALRAKGHRFAMDDYNFQEQLEPFLPYCSYIKVDIRQVDRDRLVRELPSLRKFSAALVAEKVETVEEFEFYRSLGFEYFQGYFFCKPKIVSSPTTRSNRMTLCKLASRLQHANVTMDEVESIMGEDPGLSYRLLRYINSAAVAIPRKIDSIRHAVRMVGLDHIRALASMVLLSSLDDKPRELIKTSVIRARMCQLLGEGASRQYGTYFTAGLFSTLDAFLNCSMETAMNLIPLSNEIRDALLHGNGPIGRVLASVLAFEQADWDALDKAGVDSLKVASAYLDAIRWGEELLH